MKESRADMQKENRKDEGNRNSYADTAFYPGLTILFHVLSKVKDLLRISML